MSKKTALSVEHEKAGAKWVDFSGWDMPIQYTSLVEEHHAVRQKSGMFDVSHMTVVDLAGAKVAEFLSYLLANDVAKLKTQGAAPLHRHAQ